MKKELLKYVTLAKFLKEALGSRYEITIRSVDHLEQKMCVEDRTLHQEEQNLEDLGILLDILNSTELKKRDYLCGFTEGENAAEVKQNSIFYIRDDDGEIIGFLSICEKITASVSVKDVFDEMLSPVDAEPNNIGIEVENLIKEQIERVWTKYTSGKKKITKKDKLNVMRDLLDMGLLRMKGTMDQVAKVTGISSASLYRYLSEVIEE